MIKLNKKLVSLGYSFEAMLRSKGYKTNKEFASEYGVKYASFSRYIAGLKSGKRGGHLDTLIKYLDFLEVSLSELVNFFENNHNK